VRVVIWERDRDFRRTIVRLVDSALTSPGDASEIECVANAAEFTGALTREPAQLVIIDEESASSAAESAIRALRAAPRGDEAEVLVLNRDWSLDASRLTALRATELPKPINPQVVRSVLARMAAHIAERRKLASASGPRPEAPPGDGDVLETQRVVLVVEDYEDMRILFAERIRAEGFDVITARDGAAAVDLAVRFRPRVVLMDLALPTIDGWEATRRIRRALGYGSGVSPSIIAVSALDRDRDRADALRAGCDGFVAKPCSPEVVVSVVRTFMDAVS
jgi:DNA-binding response OmpR family regulator